MDKRIIEETPSTEVLNDDWLIKDSPTGGTTKILGAKLKEIISGDVEDSIDKILDSIAPEWRANESYSNGKYVMYEGELYVCFVNGSTVGQFKKNTEWLHRTVNSMVTKVIRMIAQRFYASTVSPPSTTPYSKGDLVWYSQPYHEDELYICKQDLPNGDTEWVPEHWDKVTDISGLSKYLMDKIAEAGQIDDVQVKTTGDYESVVDENKVAKIDLSNMLIEKSVPNLPQPIATFNDGSDLPLKSLTASIVPVQDLHGYDSPWAGGAGKNKLPINSLSISGGGITAIIDRDSNNNVVSVTVNGTASGTVYVILNTFTLPSGTYTMSGCPSNGGIDSYRIYDDKHVSWADNGSGASFTLSEASQVAPTIRIANGYTVNNLKFYPMIESGNTKTAYAPYSNICPISGWTEEVITRCGKNFIPNTGYIQGLLGWNEDTAESIIASYNFITSPYIKVNPNTNYAIHTYAGAIVRLYITDKNHNKVYWKGNHPTAGETELLNIPANGYYVRFSIGIDGQSVEPSDYGTLVYAQLELGSTATTYEPYAGTTATIPFVDGQGQSVEVFGGSVDVVNGVVTPCPYYASYNGEELTGEWISDRDVYAPNTTPTIGAQVVNIGATGTPFYTQPTSIKSLDGDNNVSASTGQIEDLEYIANATDVIANLEARVTALES